MLKRFPLHWQILIAIIGGVLYGIFAYSQTVYIEWMGELFLRLLKMIVVPLIFFIITAAVGSIKSEKKLGKLGIKTAVYYAGTTLIAIVTGIALTLLFQPGAGIDLALLSQENGGSSELSKPMAAVSPLGMGEMILHIVPTNVFKAMAEGETLSVVFAALFVGVILARMKDDDGNLLLRFFNAGSNLMIRVTMAIIALAPLGIFSLIACRVAEMGGDSEKIAALFKALSLYCVTILTGLSLHFFITLSIILLCYGLNPLAHMKNMLTPLLTAFSTATSNATIPFSLEALTQKENVSKEVAGFTIPLGATVNMNGTALYECVIVLFLAQAYGMDLTLAQMGVIVFTALLSAIGTAGIPMASLVMITIILNAVHIPLEGLGLIFIVDRIFDMLRTTVNIYGDTCCAVCVARSEGEDVTIALGKKKEKGENGRWGDEIE